MATLGTVQELRAELRVRLGYINDTIILPDPAVPAALSPSETPLDMALREALRAVNKHWPIYGIGSFVTVADQQAYQPLPGNGRALVDVFWSDASCSAEFAAAWPSAVVGDLTAALGDVVEGEGGVRLSVQPHALAIMRRHRSTLERYFGRSKTITDRDTVYLSPRPSSAGTTVYFIFSQARFGDVDEVTDDIPELVDAFWARAEQKGHMVLGTGAGAVRRVRGPDGTVVEVDVASHHRAAADAEQRFVDQLDLAPSWWVSY